MPLICKSWHNWFEQIIWFNVYNQSPHFPNLGLPASLLLTALLPLYLKCSQLADLLSCNVFAKRTGCIHLLEPPGWLLVRRLQIEIFNGLPPICSPVHTPNWSQLISIRPCLLKAELNRQLRILACQSLFTSTTLQVPILKRRFW